MEPVSFFESMEQDAVMEHLDEGNQQLPIMKFFSGQQMSKCIYICAKLGIAEKMGNTLQAQRSCFDIAQEIGAHGESLYRMMRAMATEGVFRECVTPSGEKGIFQHSKLSIQLLDPLVRDSTILHCGTAFFQSWESLYDTIMTGKSHGFASLQSNSLYEYLNKNPAQGLEFAKGMASLSHPVVQHLVKMGDFGKFNTVCDVGGSHGMLINEILKNFPNIKEGLNFDQPEVFENLKKMGDRNFDLRFREVPGNFFVSVPEADCYVFKWVLHNWSDEKCLEILSTVSKSIRAGGKVYLAEHIGEDAGAGFSLKKKYVSFLDLHMMNLFNSRVRTLSEWKVLISKTEFQIDEVVESNVGLTQNFIVLSKKQ